MNRWIVSATLLTLAAFSILAIAGWVADVLPAVIPFGLLAATCGACVVVALADLMADGGPL